MENGFALMVDLLGVTPHWLPLPSSMTTSPDDREALSPCLAYFSHVLVFLLGAQ
jgi:hypothetical protein